MESKVKSILRNENTCETKRILPQASLQTPDFKQLISIHTDRGFNRDWFKFNVALRFRSITNNSKVEAVIIRFEHFTTKLLTFRHALIQVTFQTFSTHKTFPGEENFCRFVSNKALTLKNTSLIITLPYEKPIFEKIMLNAPSLRLHLAPPSLSRVVQVYGDLLLTDQCWPHQAGVLHQQTWLYRPNRPRNSL